MPQPMIVNGMVQVNGNVDVSQLVVGRGGVLASSSGLHLWSDGGIVIFGTVRGGPGAPLFLASRKGNILVLGQVISDRGRDGDSEGQAGQAGGSVHLSAPRGEVIIAGWIQAGAGGDGAAAIDFPSPSDTRGGNGAAGGGVWLEGRQISIRSGRIIAGNGGRGGRAIAEGGDPEVIMEWIMEHTRPGGPTDSPPDGAPIPELFPKDQIRNKKVAALSGNAGAGGSIRLAAAAQGWALAGATLHAGHGGDAGDARALRAENAKAYVGMPGPGGNLLFEISGGGGGWQRNALEKPGRGGSAETARAAGTEFAEAHVDGGGTGGEVRIQGASTAPREKGGDVGTGSVRTSNCHRVSPAATGAIGLPAAPVELKCP